MKANNRVGEVSIKTHSGSKSNRHIRKKPHAKRGQGSNGSSSSDKITVDDAQTEVVIDIIGTSDILGISTDTGSTTVSEYRSIDLSPPKVSQTHSISSHHDTYGYNICHGKEGGETSPNLRQEARTSSCFGLHSGHQSRRSHTTQLACRGRKLTYPEPSRRNLLPTMLRATASLIWCV